MKYGNIKVCNFCGLNFETRPRFLEYCSTPCKNPNNRPGHEVWNKGLNLTEEQKSKLNMSGLEKGRQYWKGKENLDAKKRFLENNPNKDGRLNNLRPKKSIDNEYELYFVECRKATYRTVKILKEEGLVPKTGKKKTDMQLDHIIPYRQGYELNISPAIIGGRSNLRYILGSENRKKWDTYQTVEIVKSIAGENYDLFKKGS